MNRVAVKTADTAKSTEKSRVGSEYYTNIYARLYSQLEHGLFFWTRTRTLIVNLIFTYTECFTIKFQGNYHYLSQLKAR